MKPKIVLVSLFILVFSNTSHSGVNTENGVEVDSRDPLVIGCKSEGKTKTISGATLFLRDGKFYLLKEKENNETVQEQVQLEGECWIYPNYRIFPAGGL